MVKSTGQSGSSRINDSFLIGSYNAAGSLAAKVGNTTQLTKDGDESRAEIFSRCFMYKKRLFKSNPGTAAEAQLKMHPAI